MKLTCYVVDDEPLAVELMEGYVRKTPFLELKGSFYSASATFEALGREAVDLLFCDIQMPELSGMELARMLPERTRVIFTTAFSNYAVEGFRVNALDPMPIFWSRPPRLCGGSRWREAALPRHPSM